MLRAPKCFFMILPNITWHAACGLSSPVGASPELRQMPCSINHAAAACLRLLTQCKCLALNRTQAALKHQHQRVPRWESLQHHLSVGKDCREAVSSLSLSLGLCCSASSALFPNDTFIFLPQSTLTRVLTGLWGFSLDPLRLLPGFVHMKHRRQETEERWRYGGGRMRGGRRSSRKGENERKERLKYGKDRSFNKTISDNSKLIKAIKSISEDKQGCCRFWITRLKKQNKTKQSYFTCFSWTFRRIISAEFLLYWFRASMPSSRPAGEASAGCGTGFMQRPLSTSAFFYWACGGKLQHRFRSVPPRKNNLLPGRRGCPGSRLLGLRRCQSGGEKPFRWSLSCWSCFEFLQALHRS